jgi:hypothetical protein
MTTQNESTASPAATSRRRIRDWLVVAANVVVVAAGIYSAYSLAASRHESMRGTPTTHVSFQPSSTLPTCKTSPAPKDPDADRDTVPTAVRVKVVVASLMQPVTEYPFDSTAR